mmetsp:Transcript_2265/g.4181  ORF Transcript_2265/g.4181 Transcript_2265/m.4181 type:complete len:404 (+) Transcript_2265:185-1396(+)
MYKRGMMEGLGGPVKMDDYTLDGIDPCLEDCCRREVESNRRYNALTSTLRRHDVALLAERHRRNLIKTPEFEGCRCCYDPNSDGGEYRALIEFKEEKQREKETYATEDDEEENTDPAVSSLLVDSEKEKVSSDADDDSDDEFDYLLDEDLPGEDERIKELEENRRAELEYQLLMRQVAGQHGYGVARQLHPARVLKAAGLGMGAAGSASGRVPPPAVVLHLVDPDSMASASLDYYFETELAPKHPGTVFLRSGGRGTLLMDQTLSQQVLPASVLNPDSALPALIAIRDGVVVNACPNLQGLTTASRHDDGVVEPHAVRQWLDRSGVLLTDPPRVEDICFIRPEEEALLDYMSSQPQLQQRQEERYDCGLEGCNKSFPHEHVGIQTSEQDGLVVKEETVLGTEE